MGALRAQGGCTDPRFEGDVMQVFLDEGTRVLSCKGYLGSQALWTGGAQGRRVSGLKARRGRRGSTKGSVWSEAECQVVAKGRSLGALLFIKETVITLAAQEGPCSHSVGTLW